jgi:hypothetical protein
MLKVAFLHLPQVPTFDMFRESGFGSFPRNKSINLNTCPLILRHEILMHDIQGCHEECMLQSHLNNNQLDQKLDQTTALGPDNLVDMSQWATIISIKNCLVHLPLFNGAYDLAWFCQLHLLCWLFVYSFHPTMVVNCLLLRGMQPLTCVRFAQSDEPGNRYMAISSQIDM